MQKSPAILVAAGAMIGIVLALCISFPFAGAKSGSMPLLAMSELEEGVYRGSIADLSLEIVPGKGRVFVNTFPISKLDTQMSMRFAMQVACKHSNADCKKNDFIYTIKAEAGIVGGPSAGAAAAVLTVALLEKIRLSREIAITGTINSGEIIGPVGGVRAKVDAASKAGMRKVIVPKWGVEDGENLTSIFDYGNELGIEVAEASTLSEALYHFTGKRETTKPKELAVDPEYEKVMKSLAVMLCGRSRELEEEYLGYMNRSMGKNAEPGITESVIRFEDAAMNQTEKASRSFEAGDYYTSASYCFRANINYRNLIYIMQGLSQDELSKRIEAVGKGIADFEEDIENRKLETLTDLQAYMITKERIDEAKENLELARKKDSANETSDLMYWLAFASERLYSAFSWSYFFGAEGQEFKIDRESLKGSCEIKLSEAEERYQYVSFYFGSVLSSAREGIEKAKAELKDEDYIMCLYKASLAKSMANTIMDLIGVDENESAEVFSQKLGIAKHAISEQQENGIFPIMGYSYFEYANSLSDDEMSSAMVYADYALELSNFDFYFEKKGVAAFLDSLPAGFWNIAVVMACILAGFLAGAAFAKGSKIKKLQKNKANAKGR